MTAPAHVWDLDIQKDGLTYCIGFNTPFGVHRVEALLDEPEGIWSLHITSHDRVHVIGRRKLWQQALADALVIVEALARELENMPAKGPSGPVAPPG